MRRSLMLGVLVFVQHITRPADDLRRQAGKLGDLDPVAAVGSAGLDLAQEDNPAGILFYRDVEILHAFKAIEFRELVVVRGEESFRAAARVNELDDRPSDGQAVIGRRTPANLVEENERLR